MVALSFALASFYFSVVAILCTCAVLLQTTLRNRAEAISQERHFTVDPVELKRAS